MADLDTDWQSIKSISSGIVSWRRKAVPAEDLADDWSDVCDIPKVFYFVIKGFNLKSMAIKQLRYKGQIKKHVTARRIDNVYIGITEKVLWGPDHKVKQEEGRRRYSKENCDLTLEQALCRLNQYREDHLKRHEDDIRHWEESIAKFQAEIDRIKVEDREFAEPITLAEIQADL